MYFPSKDSEQETGLKRGSVVLCADDELNSKLQSCQTLRDVDLIRAKMVAGAKIS